ncbi:MAG: hypothetical protein R2850_07585 [Bacteroidia bacterium]
MRQISAIGLLIILLLPLLTKVGVLGNYFIQYDKYANELCVNRANPDLGCNGKCQMMKELKEVDAPLAQAPVLPLVLKIKDFQFIHSQSPFESGEAKSIVNSTFPELNQEIIKGIQNKIFQPPRTASFSAC